MMPQAPVTPGNRPFSSRLGQPIQPQTPKPVRRSFFAPMLGQIGNYAPRSPQRQTVGQLQSSLGFGPAPAVPTSPGSRIASSPGTQVTGPPPAPVTGGMRNMAQRPQWSLPTPSLGATGNTPMGVQTQPLPGMLASTNPVAQGMLDVFQNASRNYAADQSRARSGGVPQSSGPILNPSQARASQQMPMGPPTSDDPASMIANSPYLQQALPPAMQQQLMQSSGPKPGSWAARLGQGSYPSTRQQMIDQQKAQDAQVMAAPPGMQQQLIAQQAMQNNEALFQQSRLNAKGQNRTPTPLYAESYRESSSSGPKPGSWAARLGQLEAQPSGPKPGSLAARLGEPNRNQQVYSDAYNQALESRMNQNGATSLARRLGLQDQTSGIREVANNTQDQRAFQPKAGTYGNSTVTVSPDGKATMTGGYAPRRLAQLGVVERVDPSIAGLGGMSAESLAAAQNSLPDDFFGQEVSTGDVPMVKDRSAMYARQGANRRRMENMSFAKRLGQAGEYDPGDPVPPGESDASVYTARLGDMRQDRGRFSDMLAQRNLERQGQPQGRFSRALGGDMSGLQSRPAQDPALAGQRRRQGMVSSLLGRSDGVPSLEQARDLVLGLEDLIQNGGQAGGSNAGVMSPVPMSNPVEAQRRLTSQDTGYQAVLGVLEVEPDDGVETIARKIINRQRSQQPLSAEHLRLLQQFLKDRKAANPDAFPGMDRGLLASTASLPQYFIDEVVNGNDVSQALANAQRRLNADAGRAPSPFSMSYRPIPRP